MTIGVKAVGNRIGYLLNSILLRVISYDPHVWSGVRNSRSSYPDLLEACDRKRFTVLSEPSYTCKFHSGRGKNAHVQAVLNVPFRFPHDDGSWRYRTG